MSVHLLADPGDSVLSRTLEPLSRWLHPSLRLFHVSQRASSLRSPPGAPPAPGEGPSPVVLPVFRVNLPFYPLFAC